MLAHRARPVNELPSRSLTLTRAWGIRSRQPGIWYPCPNMARAAIGVCTAQIPRIQCGPQGVPSRGFQAPREGETKCLRVYERYLGTSEAVVGFHAGQ
jgi:hypothetical protein